MTERREVMNLDRSSWNGAARPAPGNPMTVPVKILASARSQATLDTIRTALNGVLGVRLELRNGALDDLLQDPLLDRRSQLMILDLDLKSDDELKTLGRIIDLVPSGLPIIATSNVVSLDRVRPLMHLGLADFVPQPIAREDLLNSIEIAGRQLERGGLLRRQGGHIVGFCSACGGMGATTLAVQSAFITAQRLGGGPGVCLLDLDLQFGNAGLYLDVDSGPDVTDCLVEPARIDPILVQSVVHKHAGGFDVIKAPDRLVDLSGVPLPSLQALLYVLRQEYRLVIVDMPRVWASWTDMVMADFDALVLVTQLTVPGIRRARIFLDFLAECDLGQISVLTVANRYDKPLFSEGIRRSEAEVALGRRFDATVPSDFKAISESINAGIAVTEVRRRSAIASNLRKLWDRILVELDQARRSPAVSIRRGVAEPSP